MNRLKMTDIRLAWDIIKPDIDALRVDLNMEWRSEDVYSQCLTGKSFLWGCSDGFVIVHPRENPFTLEKELFVWICVSHIGDGLTEYYPDICAIAKDVHCTSIVFESPRDGFRKLAKANNWRSLTTHKMQVV